MEGQGYSRLQNPEPSYFHGKRSETATRPPWRQSPFRSQPAYMARSAGLHGAPDVVWVTDQGYVGHSAPTLDGSPLPDTGTPDAYLPLVMGQARQGWA